MGRRNKGMSSTDAVLRAVTNRKTKSTTWSRQVKDLVKAFGKDGAREKLGVSESTWRRWTNGRGKPSKANLGKLADQWATPEVRRSMIPKRRSAKAGKNGFSMKIVGKLSPKPDEKYLRYRSLSLQMPPEIAQEIMDAFVDGGPEAADDVLQMWLEDAYYYGEDPDREREGGGLMSDIESIVFSARDEPPAGSVFDQYPE